MNSTAAKITAALDVVKLAVDAVELAERGVRAALDTLAKGRADLAKATAELDHMKTQLAADDAKHERDLEERLKR